jgi:hypothetical protein
MRRYDSASSTAAWPAQFDFIVKLGDVAIDEVSLSLSDCVVLLFTVEAVCSGLMPELASGWVAPLPKIPVGVRVFLDTKTTAFGLVQLSN